MNLIESIYYYALTIKKMSALRTQKRLSCKVISIGNLTVGGTGKTPAAIAIAEEAKKRGLRPVILTRGYRGKARGPCFVTTGDRPLLTTDEAGDEPVLMAERLQGIPIVKGANRYEAGIFALNHPDLQLSDTISPVLFILDDGYQHWGLWRDKDILLISAVRPFGNGKLLPLGILREPVSSVERADVIVVTNSKAGGGTEDNPDIGKIIREIHMVNKKAPVFFAEHRPIACRLLAGEKRPAAWLAGKRIYGFCALGSPESFRRTLLSLGAELAGFKTFRDHHRYRQKDLDIIRQDAEKCRAEWIVTTEKDIIKIRNLDLPVNIFIIEIVLSVEGDFFGEVFSS